MTRTNRILLTFTLMLGMAASARGMDAPFVCGEVVEKVLARAESRAATADRKYKSKPHLTNEGYHRLAGLNPVWLANYRKYKRIRLQANLLELHYFGKGSDGDEGDAYRHFLGTVLLAKRVGLDQAMWIPRIHDAGQFHIQAEMDKFNNGIALAYAKTHLREIRAADEETLGQRIFELLPSTGVAVIRPKTTVYCGNLPGFAAWVERTLAKK